MQDSIGEADLIAAVRSQLAQRVGQARAELWFGRRAHLSLSRNQLVVEAPNDFYCDWLRRNFSQQLREASSAVIGGLDGLEFRVAQSATAIAEPSTALVPAVAASEPVLMAVADPMRADDAATAPSAGRGGALRRQRPLAELADFVVGQSNRLAFASTEMAIRDLGRYSPLCIHGSTGVGKTHLLEGLCSEAARMRPRVCAIYQTAEQFTSEFLHALHHSGLPNFRRKYRGVDLLVIDDVQFLAGKRATLIEAQHTFDTLLRQGRQLVLTADRPLAELTELGPELVARLSGGMSCRIAPAEFEVRREIVGRMSARLDLSLTDDIINLVAARFSQHARQLIGAVHRLKAASEAHGEAMTCMLAEEALADLAPEAAPRGLQLADIERAICDEFKLEADALRSDGKAKALSQPRALAMWLARKHTRSALSEIGSYFGRRSHTTVLAAHKRVENWMATPGRSPRSAGANIEETLRRVEQRLRVG